ncbi:MAG: type II toxin-antitoxin system VapC family toxin [Xanthomonadales bacterium]|nr:type II toxin-antitoxin system VapC family toxin [Xanthomonadales bacterium]
MLVRLLVNDDRLQATRARELIEDSARRDEPVFVSLLVLLETEWALRNRYGLEPDAIRGAFGALLETRELLVEDASVVEIALSSWEQPGTGFADCLIAACHRARGCRTTLSFDARARRISGFTRA